MKKVTLENLSLEVASLGKELNAATDRIIEINKELHDIKQLVVERSEDEDAFPGIIKQYQGPDGISIDVWNNGTINITEPAELGIMDMYEGDLSKIKKLRNALTKAIKCLEREQGKD